LPLLKQAGDGPGTEMPIAFDVHQGDSQPA
jgi:hypothetical protein